MRRPPIVLIALALSRPLLAQAPLAFDAATVRINHTPPEVIYTRTEPGGRFVASGASLRLLIMTAYAGQTAPRIVGGPNWIDSVQFDISARSEGATPAQTRTMLRTLLADRFKLAVHTETQQLPVYELVVAKSDGRPGSGLRASTASCPPPAPQPGSGPPPPPPTSASGVRLCGIGGRSGQWPASARPRRNLRARCRRASIVRCSIVRVLPGESMSTCDGRPMSPRLRPTGTRRRPRARQSSQPSKNSSD